MKILHVINGLASGGAEKLLDDYLPILSRAHDITVELLILTDKNAVFCKMISESNIKLDVIRLRSLYSPLNVLFIRDHIMKGRYDVVHAHLFPTIYWVSLASRLIRGNKPHCVMTEHSTYNGRRKFLFLQPAEKLVYSSYDVIVSISQATQQNLVSWLKPTHRNLAKFVVIENGVDIDKFRRAKPYMKQDIHDKFTERTRIICMVGRFSKVKDQQTLIQAMGMIPDDVHLLLVGEGALMQLSQDLAEEIGVHDRVHFLGFRDDVDRLLATADVVIQSSKWEGFGLAAVEAMAAGKPVVATDVAGLRDVVGGAGRLVPPGDETALADAINGLLENMDEYCNVAHACSTRALSFGLEKRVIELVELYRRIV